MAEANAAWECAQNLRQRLGGGVLEIQLDRPDKKNALTAVMYDALAAAFERAAADDEVKVALLSGNGDIFTAGNDLPELKASPPYDTSHPVYRFMHAFSNFAKIAIVAVEGDAIGIGTNILLHADVVVAGKGARFGLPFIRLGLTPGFASSLMLPALMGRQQASRLLLLAETFDAETALSAGIITRIVASGTAIQAARTVARQLAAHSLDLLVATKALLTLDQASIVARIAAEAPLFSERLRSPQFASALRSFHQKAERPGRALPVRSSEGGSI